MRTVVRHRDSQLVAQQRDLRASDDVVDYTGHLGQIGTDEQIHRGAGDDLSNQSVRTGEVEHDPLSRHLLVGGSDIGDDTGQTRRGGDEQLLLSPSLRTSNQDTKKRKAQRESFQQLPSPGIREIDKV